MKNVGDAAGSEATNAYMQVMRCIAAIITRSGQHAHARRATDTILHILLCASRMLTTRKVGHRAQLVRQEVEGHHSERDNLRARGVGEPLFAPTTGCPIVHGVFRSPPEPRRRLFGAHLIVRQILLR